MEDDSPVTLEHRITDNLDLLLAALPPRIRDAVLAPQKSDLLEIVMDLGRPPEARFLDETLTLYQEVVTDEDLLYVTARVGEFGDDNRAGIERTLHRISAIRNRQGKVIGLTCRVGRAVYGTVTLIRDVIEQGRSLLILGRPGVGKTTMLRETARVLADDLGKRVVIVDTSNEIAGDGDVPHPGIGRARRLQVPRVAEQHAVMIEAVENHMPEVIIIDEIGTELEAQAARTIAERGVQLVGTAHGNTLDNLLLNPTLSDLVGGISSVTLGDEEARRRGTQKTVLERKAPPTFDVVVEQQERLRVLLHPDVAAAVDALLRGEVPAREVRELDQQGTLQQSMEAPRMARLEELRSPLIPRPRQVEQVRDRRSAGIGPVGPRGRSDEGRMPERPHGVNGNGVPQGNGADRSRRPIDGTIPIVTQSTIRHVGNAPDEDSIVTRFAPINLPPGTARRSIYPLGINRSRLEQVVHELGVPVTISHDEEEADIIFVLESIYRKQPDRIDRLMAAGKPVYRLRTGTAERLRGYLADLFGAQQS